MRVRSKISDKLRVRQAIRIYFPFRRHPTEMGIFEWPEAVATVTHFIACSRKMKTFSSMRAKLQRNRRKKTERDRDTLRVSHISR